MGGILSVWVSSHPARPKYEAERMMQMLSHQSPPNSRQVQGAFDIVIDDARMAGQSASHTVRLVTGLLIMTKLDWASPL